ncbi:WecB/TagA/CpsF family glycosyltransferase [Pedobacter sp. SYP-B3415]|uniref:WecB/TagA/CpsF family glycosyltransferase n=1 Tax=Pedobacter sp. SYP-B3415 TaxID=2496641 RepID=UPI00101CCDD2|nr:WecB/TagA/CpsF family glycosyltransferase [Pedobacter sp. SYP-B3415]
MLDKKRIISIDVSSGTYNQFLEEILALAQARKSSYVCVANVHMLLEAHQSKDFQNIVNTADLVTPDGMPLANSFKLLYNQKQDRVDGMSLLPRLLKQSEERNLSVYFYGGSQVMLDRVEAYIRENHPTLTIAGLYSPPFRPLTPDEKEATAVAISSSGAAIVFVVLGCPKQERWMSDMKGKIPAVMVGVGGALPVLVGLQKRAPEWMQKNSLEWFFRLCQEPKRLFKRYFKTNTWFLYLLVKELAKKRN